VHRCRLIRRFDPNNTWWPSPGWPRSGPLGASYPDDWTDPFLNPRPIAPAAIAPFSAASLGAMAWHPPIFPGDWASSPPSNLPQTAWPAPVPPAASISNTDPTGAPAWPDPQSPYLSPAPSAAPGASRSSDNLGWLLSYDPSFPLGLFPHPFGPDPGPISPFGSGPFSAAGPTASTPIPSLPGAASAPGWAASLRAPLGQISSPAAPPDDRTSPFVSLLPIDKLGGLFSHDPSVPVGLFPFPFDSDPGPSPQFGTGLFSAGSPAASGWAASLLAPLGPLEDPFAAGNPTQDNSRGLSSGPTDSATTPTASPQSVLFNRPQPNWDLNSALIARDRDAAALDAVAQGLGADGLPRSKSGAPYDAPSVAPAPLLSFEPPQWLDVAHFLSPNIVDYLTKTLPPAPPFPSTPGKIPSTDNPYAPGAAIEAVAWLAAALERAMAAPLVGVAGFVEKRAADAALRAARTAVDAQALTRAGEAFVARPYGELSGTLPAGWQAHHLNQHAVYGGAIPREEGLSVPLWGNAITDPGTSHFLAHQWLEQQFWNQYRRNGSLLPRPSNAEYGEAARLSLIAGGVPPAQASNLAVQAAAQRAAKGLSETAPVPRIPGPINQRQ
jgi:hypothetical protein